MLANYIAISPVSLTKETATGT